METTQDSTNGFNYHLGQTWIYPTNLPVRKYQKTIVGEALFKNTMVCLPTGLGKTFIAAVVMYNYYRWFPFDKVVFMATTKPLVSQQIDACYKIVGLPKNTTAELTGSTLKQNRQQVWATKRVFFITPQVLLNDLDSINDLGMKIKCIVIDEAHRARGNHAYCEVIRKLSSIHSHFRVLALTATPASSVAEVIAICNTLLISHIEVRSESSLDVLPFVHSKQMDTIVIPLTGKLQEIVEKYKIILDKYVRILVNHNVLQSNFHSLHKGRLFYLSKEYDEKNRHKRSTSEYKLIKKVFGTCTILYHAQDLLVRHGLRSFLTFFRENVEKPLLYGCADEIKELMAEIVDHVGPELSCEKLPNGEMTKLPPNCIFGHPKFYKLREILRKHFCTETTDSKVIVFCEYRESVAEANAMLMQEENIKPKMFMGQSSISQRQQLQIIDSFRKGDSNTLISTCIAEEGIDVGFVDLVICFDVSNKSSLRLVQRIGRTGRNRRGRAVFLVTQGREEQVLKESLKEKKHLTSALLEVNGLRDRLYQNSPRMVPFDVSPECNEIFIAVEGVASKSTSIKNWFQKSSENHNSETSVNVNFSPVISSYSDLIPETRFISLNQQASNLEVISEKLDFSRNVDCQRIFHAVELNSFMRPSSSSKIFVDLMKMVEYKKLNLPVGKLRANTTNARNKTKQTDIRCMFKQQLSMSQSESNTIDLSTELNPSHEVFISSVLNANEECRICEHFDMDIPLKKELVPIPFYFKTHTNSNVLNKEILLHYLQASEGEKQTNNSFNEANCNYIDIYKTAQEQSTADQNGNENSECHIVPSISQNQEALEDLQLDSIVAAAFSEPMNEPHQKTKKFECKENEETDAFYDSDDMFDHINIADTKSVQISDSPKPTLELHDNSKRKSPFDDNENAMDCTGRSEINPRKKRKLSISDVFQETLFMPTQALIEENINRNIHQNEVKNCDTALPSLSLLDVFQDSLFEPENKLKLPNNSNATITKPVLNILTNTSTRKQGDDTLEKICLSNKKVDENIRINTTNVNNFVDKIDLNELNLNDVFNIDLCSNLNEKDNQKEANKIETITISSDEFSNSGELSPILSSWCTTKRKEVAKSNPHIVQSQHSPVIRPPRRHRRYNNLDATVAEETFIKPAQQKKKANWKENNDNARAFLDSQVEISSDELVSDDELLNKEDDVYEVSFVNDEPLDEVNLTQMKAVYLQSVRSPKKRPLRSSRRRQVEDTFVEHCENETYVKDSFCVDSDTEPESPTTGFSELEKAELELERRRKMRNKSDLVRRKKRNR